MIAAHNARIFRLFVSSTFSDFIAEREALQTQVFPELEKYCAERGARFLAVDLRWGITEEAQQEHNTMRICLEEVRRCQELSPRPNFAVLLGDRYGWEPVPARISMEHWKRLKAAAHKNDWQLIDDSYRLDKNAIPPVYCLKNRKKNLSAAFANEARLLQALRAAAKGFRGTARLPYFASATHQEIALGALSKYGVGGCPLEPEQHVHVYVRHIEAIPQDKSAKDFIDWDASKGEVTLGARGRLRGLVSQLRRQLGDHVHDLHTTWNSQGSESTANNAYLTSFCDTFLSHQKALIDAALESLEQTDERQQREQAHQDFGAERARVFAGRKALLARIARYATPTPKGIATQSKKSGASTAPLVLLGEGGSGKSSLLARAVQETKLQLKHPATVVVQRYIGGVPGTESLMTMLTELTADIASLYGQPEPPIPENAKSLVQSFQTALCHASSERPLALYLDALDQLNSADSAWMLEWLPKELPEYVRVVTTVRTGTTVEQSARRHYPRNLIEVPLMKPAEGRAMLKAWLKDRRTAWFNAGIAPTTGRRLTANQQLAVLRVFDKSGSALWLKLAFEDAATWASWDTPRKLPPTVQGLIEDFLEHRLLKKENHPKVFTEQALAYLTAGRFGLSESELGRTLGLDPAVRAEFQANEKTQRKWSNSTILPPILWSRLFFDLQAYLGLAKVDGALLMRWFHREFAEVLKARYLCTPEQRNSVHGALADTFQVMERELREGETTDETLFLATEVGGKQVSAALRRVMEQPWQLAQARQQEVLQALLTDFSFCMGKCAANRSEDLVLNFLSARINDSPLGAINTFYVSEGHILRRGTSTWPSHRILLQRASETKLGHPIRQASSSWLESGHCTWDWLRLMPDSRTSLSTTIRDATELVFEGHDDGVRDARFLSNHRLLSWSIDGSLKLWDTRSGHCIQSMLRNNDNVWDVAIHNETLALACYVYSSVCIVWNVVTGEQVAELAGHSQPVTGCEWLTEDRALTWSEDGSVRLWRCSTGNEEQRFNLHTAEIAGLCILPNGKVTSWDTSGVLWIWNPVDPTEAQQVAKGSSGSAVAGAVLTMDGLLLYWTKRGSVYLSDLAMQTFAHVFDVGQEEVSHGHEANRVSSWEAGRKSHTREVAPGLIACWQESLVPSGEHEHVIEIWDLDRRVRRGRLTGHWSTIEGVLIAPDHRLISYDNSGETRLWNLEHCSEQGVFHGLGQARGACLVPPNRLIASATDIRIWDIESGRLIAIWDDFGAAGEIIPASANRMLVTLRDGSMRLVNVAGQLHEPDVESNAGRVTATTVVGHSIVAGHQDGSVSIFDAREGRLAGSAKVHSERVKRITKGFGDVVISVGEDGAVGMIDVRDLARKWLHETHRHLMGAEQISDGVVQVFTIGNGFRLLDAVSGRELASIPDANSRASGFRDPRFRGTEIFNREGLPAEVWDSRTGAFLYRLEGHTDDVLVAEFVDASTLVTASKDKTIRVWNHPEGKCRHLLQGHKDRVVQVEVLAPRRIVSYAGKYRGGSTDLCLRIWDVIDGCCIAVLDGHQHTIYGTLILESGRLLSWSETGEVRLWCLDEFRLLSAWRWHWGSISSLREFGPDSILARNRDGRAFVWSMSQDTVEEFKLHDYIESRGVTSGPFLPLEFDSGLSTAEFNAQWIDRRLVVRRQSDSALIKWHADNPGELHYIHQTGIFSITEGLRMKFVELVRGK